MSWLITAQQDNGTTAKGALIRDLEAHFEHTTRFSIGDSFYSIRRHLQSWQASKSNVETNEYIDASPLYVHKSRAVKWVATMIPPGWYDGSDTDPELASQFNARRSITIGQREFAPFHDHRNGRFGISRYSEAGSAMEPYRTRRPSMSTKVHYRDASTIIGYAFSRFNDLVTFMTSRTFRLIAQAPSRHQVEVYNSSNDRASDPSLPTIIGIVRELADLHDLPGGIVVTGRSLSTVTEAREDLTAAGFNFSDYDDVSYSADPKDVFLSFRMSLIPEDRKLEDFFTALRSIISTYYPNRSVELVDHSLGPMIAVRYGGASSAPVSSAPVKPVKPFQPAVDPEADSSFEAMLDEDDDDFGLVFSSNKRKPIIVSFDYDGTTVFPDESDGEIKFDEDGEAVSILNPEAAELMRLHAGRGDTVVIVTARIPTSLDSVWKTINDNGLPVSEVYATSYASKAPTLRSIGASIHYDDDPFRLAEIRAALGPSIKVYRETEMEDNIRAWRGL